MSTIREAISRTLYAIRPLSEASVREQVDDAISKAHGQVHAAGCNGPECERCRAVKPAVLSAISAMRTSIEAGIREAHASERRRLVSFVDQVLFRAAIAYLVLQALFS